jgi:hypothetical protein
MLLHNTLMTAPHQKQGVLLAAYTGWSQTDWRTVSLYYAMLVFTRIDEFPLPMSPSKSDFCVLEWQRYNVQ